jgi:phytoene dehydrogenase-like protein
MTLHTSLPLRTIVVGGGMAGLASAAYLARGGARVTLFEKADSVGGRASTDRQSGFALNRGAHALYSGGAASSVLGELDVHYSSGTPTRILTRDARGFKAYPASALGLLRTDLLSAADKRELIGVFLRLGMLKPERVAHQSVADWIATSAQRPRVRQLLLSTARVSLYTTALDLASADTFLARFQQTLKHPVHYVDGGWQSLVDGLRDAARTAGVDIQTGASVETIRVDTGRATGVRLYDGREVPADAVIVAAPPDDVLRVLPGSAAPRLEQAVGASVPVYVACLDLALRALPSPQHAVVFDMEKPRFMTVQSRFARLAPTGGAVLHAFLQMDPREPADPHQARAELEAFVDEAQPGWQALTVERRFLPRLQASGALPLARLGGLAGRTKYRSQDIDNLYFAGDWVGPEGYLVDASLASARASALQLLEVEAEVPALQAA